MHPFAHPFVGDPRGNPNHLSSFQNVGGFTNQTFSPFTVNYPTGLQANDVAILHVSYYDNSTPGTSITTPAGWTLIGSRYVGDDGRESHYVFCKRLTGSETGGVSVSTSPTASSTDSVTGVMSIYRGCITSGNPFEGANTAASASGTSLTHPAVVTSGDNRTIVTCFSVLFCNSIAPNAAYTERYDSAFTAGVDTCHGMADKPAPIAGTYAAQTGTATYSGGTRGYSAIGFALIPAS